jgi:hypothetical protein
MSSSNCGRHDLESLPMSLFILDNPPLGMSSFKTNWLETRKPLQRKPQVPSPSKVQRLPLARSPTLRLPYFKIVLQPLLELLLLLQLRHVLQVQAPTLGAVKH